MLLKLTNTNIDYAIPFNYIKVLKVDYNVEVNDALITYDTGNLDGNGVFVVSKDRETLHCTFEMVAENFGKNTPEIDAYNILIARAGYEGEVV